MKNNNNVSLLVASILCTVFAALVYLFKWANLYWFSASIWEIAQTFGNMGKYMGGGGYGFLSALLYCGAVLSIALLIWNAYRIARPLLNGMEWIDNAKNTKGGMIISAIFSVFFIILVYSANDGDFDGASITLWPIVEIALCIIPRVLLNKADIAYVNVASNAENQSSTMLATEQKTLNSRRTQPPQSNKTIDGNNAKEEKTDQYVRIPIINYNTSAKLQASQILYSPSDNNAAMLFACYADPQMLEAIRVKIELLSVFGDSIDGGQGFFQNFDAISKGKITYLETESISIAELSAHIREIRAARVIIDRLKAKNDSIQIPDEYEDSSLSLEALANLKALEVNRDAVCEKKILSDCWVCLCGRKNSIQTERCERCHRYKENKKEDLLDKISCVADFQALIELLDEKIADGMPELEAVKYACVSRRPYGLNVAIEAAKRMINEENILNVGQDNSK